LQHPHLDSGVFRLEGSEQFREIEERPNALHHADGQRAALQSLHRRHRGSRVSHACEDCHGLLVERFPGRCQFDAPRTADKKLRSELDFQRADRGRQGRLDDMHFLRRAREMLLVGYGDEVFELS
jgi:hypothetical protein